ncbi:MarR family transcriptional regulator [Microbacterium oryzae]|uniref:MarR family winged helix-turn-helix transcriptional regulator n=1 Tax=Microbacterium oryzae TaxID=743009 RepID=UPI0025B043C2|nr:MarR family transcriptional regulator [Microbacterium oryzae]MDN3309763.1 MarR family transcriptional regulator [Microbacterium oryzae]
MQDDRGALERGGEMQKALAAWGNADAAREGSFHGYVQALAHARFVLRKIMRILDDQAREHGLEPLNHQALLQIYGSDAGMTVSQLSDRLDIAPAFGSRLISQLDKQGLIERTPHPTDRRASIITASPDGVERLRAIDRAIFRRIRNFQDDLTEVGKFGALGVFASYVGLDGDSTLASHLRDSVRWAKEFGNA